MDSNKSVSQKQNDYLPCDSYNGKTISEDGIYTFTEAGKHYFSFIENGNVILCSEGYQSEAGCVNGIASVMKYIDQESQYKVIQPGNGNWALVLLASNFQEIARSCTFSTEDEVKKLLPGARAKAKAQLLSNGISNKNAAANIEKEDNYLVCFKYEERINEKSANHLNFIQFKHPSNDKYYFGWVTSDNKIILRSEGYASEASRDNGILSVIKNRDTKERFRVEEKKGLYYLVLTAANQLEIGRSCPQKSEADCWALIYPPAPKAAFIAAQTPEVVDSGSGFKWWWWVLPLMALLALLFLWKSCNKNEVAAPAAAVETVAPVTAVAPVATVKDTDGDGIADDVDKCPNTAGIAENMGCPEMIFYYKRDDADLTPGEKAELDELAIWMGKHPELSISLEGHTSTLGEAAYNQKLSENRTTNSVNYLVSKGVDAKRLKAVGYGEQFPVGDNSTEEGRAASRRVVIKIAK